MPTTPLNGLPYPNETDSPDVPRDIAALANALDGSKALPGDLFFSAAITRAGCLLCDGSAISRSSNAGLFSAIGVTYGAGDGSTTFNIPDFRGRTILGAGTGSGLTARTRGQTGGEENHQLSTGELASHTHTGPSHTHGFAGGENVPVSTSAFGLLSETASGGSFAVSASGSLGSISATDAAGSGATGSTGGGTAHNNMQPYGVANVFIKT